MNEPYQNYFELSIVHFMAYPEVIRGNGPIIETLTEIAEDPFFTAVEVGPINDASVRREAAFLLRRAHVKVGFGAQPIVLLGGHNPNDPDPDKRAQAIEVLKQAVDQAYELGAGRMTLLSGPAPADPGAREEQIELLIDSLNQICAYAESEGNLGITLETFDPDIEKKSLIGPNADGVRVSEVVRNEHPNFGLMLDLGHIPIQHETIAEALHTAKDHLVHAHISNCVMRNPDHPAYGDQHPRFGIEDGENDVPEVVEYLETLFEIGFLGSKTKPFVGFEVKPLPDEPPQIVIANAKRVFQEAWGQVQV
ncbi:MAG: sugar phosphate isomerase/epimerase family protein [Candidatus Bipolaricaulia bacterium]